MNKSITEARIQWWVKEIKNGWIKKVDEIQRKNIQELFQLEKNQKW